MRVMKREKPAGTDSDGPFDSVHGDAENEDDLLENTTLGPLRNGNLVSSNQQQEHSQWKPKKNGYSDLKLSS